MNQYEKRKMVLRQQLIGAEMFDALSAMEFAERYHTGTRKDGLAPELDHQISIALYALTLPHLRYREEVIATIMLHDVREDYFISYSEIHELFPDPIRAKLIADAVDAISKVVGGVKRPEEEVFEAIARDPIASIAKGCDRIHNIQSMISVFSVEKQKKYITEVHDWFFPMLKAARRRFPYQVHAYENIKFVLKSQIELVEAILAQETAQVFP